MISTKLLNNIFTWLGMLACFSLVACVNENNTAQRKSVEPGTIKETWTVSSPDDGLKFTVGITQAGALRYRVDLIETGPIIDWSDLGLITSRGNSFKSIEPVVADFSETVTVTDVELGTISQSYIMISGKRLVNEFAANTLVISIEDQETKQEMAFDVRVQDGGFGFRYRLPGDDPLHSTINAEQTSFAINGSGRFWGQPYDFPTQWQPAYETVFENGIAIGTSAGDKGTGWGFPSLFEIEGKAWLLLHESGLSSAFHGSHLEPEAPNGVYRLAFPLNKSAWGYGSTFPSSNRPWTMPWRIGVVGNDPGDILQSNLVFDFAEPSRLEDTSWIRPGVSSWSWLSDHSSSRNLEKLKDFIDLSAEMNWPYSLIDANWNTISETSMEELVTYAKEKNVGLFFWYNSGGRHNTVPEEPRNIMDNQARRRAEFAKLQRLGIKGVKVDFFQSDKQDMIALYLDILQDAADHKIMVNFHGSTIPRGWERTWPNLVSMEALRGGENYSFPSEPNYGELAPWHNTILPFTRNVIGSMDYTPVIYSEQFIPRSTTHGHETALAIIFESAVQHIGDSAMSLRQLPEEYKAFFRDLPAAWDETRYLSGVPGDYVVLARRAGNQWYIAGINGLATEKSVVLDLSFIAQAIKSAQLLHDSESGREFKSSLLPIRNIEKLNIEMNAYGGFVLIIPTTVSSR